MEGIQLGGMNGLNIRLTNVRRVEICLFLVKSSSSFDVKQVYLQTTYLSEDPRPNQRRMILLLMLIHSKQYFTWLFHLEHKIGTAAWTNESWDGTEYRGGGRIPGHPDSQGSCRSELCGLSGIAIGVLGLETLAQTGAEIVVGCGGESALNDQESRKGHNSFTIVRYKREFPYRR